MNEQLCRTHYCRINAFPARGYEIHSSFNAFSHASSSTVYCTPCHDLPDLCGAGKLEDGPAVVLHLWLALTLQPSTDEGNGTITMQGFGMFQSVDPILVSSGGSVRTPPLTGSTTNPHSAGTQNCACYAPNPVNVSDHHL